MLTRLQDFYRDKVTKQLMEQFGYSSVMEVPRITKITVNMGVGEAVGDKKIIDNASGDLEKITGQKPLVTKARKSVAGFKIREGWPVGCKVTLRRDRMYEFLDRLISVAIPRIRDFRGLNAKSFDGRGSYNMGVKEQIIFPEIDYDKIDALRGMDITITTTAKTDEEGRALLAAYSFPFRGSGPDYGQTVDDTARSQADTHCAEICRQARRAQREAPRSESAGGRARAAAPQVPGAAARREPDPPAPPLPHERPLPRCVSQVRSRTQQAARGGDAR